MSSGKFYLVGLGTGDVGNMTLRARDTIAAADVIFIMQGQRQRYAQFLEGKEVYDAGHGLFGLGRPLREEEKQDSARGAALRKTEARNMKHQYESAEAMQKHQEENRRIIRDSVAAGKTVAVLCPGDPTLFSPQISYIEEFADLSPVIIPGLSCFNAANAALQRSVTLGVNSRSVILTAARAATDGYQGTDNLEKLAASRATLVFFTMGLQLEQLVATLAKYYPGETPMAIVFHAGDSGKEHLLQATVDTLLLQTEGMELPFEHLVYIGDFLV